MRANFPYTEYGDEIASFAFVNWLVGAKLPCPLALREALTEFSGARVDWKMVATAFERENLLLNERVSNLEKATADGVLSGNLGTKERESLLKIVIGMAVAGYSFDPKSSRSPTAKEVSDDLMKLGITLSDDTIRKYLKEGADLLPPQEKA